MRKSPGKGEPLEGGGVRIYTPLLIAHQNAIFHQEYRKSPTSVSLSLLKDKGKTSLHTWPFDVAHGTRDKIHIYQYPSPGKSRETQQRETDPGTVMGRVAKSRPATPLALVGVCRRSKLRGSYNSVFKPLPKSLRLLRPKASAPFWDTTCHTSPI